MMVADAASFASSTLRPNILIARVGKLIWHQHSRLNFPVCVDSTRLPYRCKNHLFQQNDMLIDKFCLVYMCNIVHKRACMSVCRRVKGSYKCQFLPLGVSRCEEKHPQEFALRLHVFGIFIWTIRHSKFASQAAHPNRGRGGRTRRVSHYHQHWSVLNDLLHVLNVIQSY